MLSHHMTMPLIVALQVFYTDGNTPSTFAVHSHTTGEYELRFSLQAKGQARIMFASSPTGNTDGYNIVFDDGTDDSERPVSYISLRGDILVSLDEDILSGSTNEPFYIRYHLEQLSIGREEESPLLSIDEVQYKPVQYIRFQTEQGEPGRWTFYNVLVESADELHPFHEKAHFYSYHTSGDTQRIYPFSPLSSEDFELRFDVLTSGNAFLVLSPLPVDQESYTFIFDQVVEAERYSSVLFDEKAIDQHESNFLSTEDYASLYIKKQEKSLIVGRVQGIEKPLPRYINFGNLKGETSKWIFYNVSPAAEGEVQIYLQASETPVYDIRIPPGDIKLHFTALVHGRTSLLFSPERKFEATSGYRFAFTNSDILGTNRVDVIQDGVAIASYSGERLSLSDCTNFFLKIVGSDLDFGVDGEETPLFHLSDIDRDSFVFVGLQQSGDGIDIWTFFGLIYIGHEEYPEETTSLPPQILNPASTLSPTEGRVYTRSPLSGRPAERASTQRGDTGDHTPSPPAESDINPIVDVSVSTVNVTTNGHEGYRYKVGPFDLRTGSRGQFAVQAEKNAAVALLSKNISETSYYEILIGAEGNVKTELKKCLDSKCYTVVSEDTPYILKSIKKILFFIEVIPSLDGTIQIRVGTGGFLDTSNSRLLVSYEDKNPIHIEYVAVRTYETWGRWTLYQKLLLPVIGANSNREVIIRRCEARNCTLLEVREANGVLVPRKATNFFLEVSFGGKGAPFVRLGKAGGLDSSDENILVYTDSNPPLVVTMGFGTPYSVGRWAINRFIRFEADIIDFVTPASEDFVFGLGPFPSAEQSRIEFSVQADCTAEVVFTSHSSLTADNYTLSIGKERNQKTVLDKCKSKVCRSLHVVNTPGILSSVVSANFFLELSRRDGMLSARLGRVNLVGSLHSDSSTLLVFEDHDTIHVTYVGFRTVKCSGLWSASREATTNAAPTASPEHPLTTATRQIFTDASVAPSRPPPTLQEDPVDKVIFETSAELIDHYQYAVGPIVPVRPSRFEFLLQAQSDAVVALSSSDSVDHPSYKIHIGANRNSETHLMRCSSKFYCPARLTVKTPNLLKANGVMKFFVELVLCSSTNKLKIRLGLAGDMVNKDSVIMDYEDEEPLSAVMAGFGTIGVVGHWVVYRFLFYSGTTQITLFSTGRYQSTYMAVRNEEEMKFSFSVAAQQNALIGLSNNPEYTTGSDVMQIRLDVGDNRRSLISRNGEEIVSTDSHFGHISVVQNSTFWVKVDGAIVEVGRDGSDHFMVAELKEPVRAKYIWFASGDAKSAYHWMSYKYFYYSSISGHLESTHDVDIFNAHIAEQTQLMETFDYTFIPLDQNYFGKYCRFSVSAEGSIYVILTSRESQEDEKYEIAFEGTEGKDIKLRRCGDCKVVSKAHEPRGLISAENQKQLWVALYDGTLKLYEELSSNPVLEWTDSDQLPASFAGFSLKSSATFTFYPASTSENFNQLAPAPWFYAVQVVTTKEWCIKLYAEAERGKDVYEIVFRAGTTSRSEIRRGIIPVVTKEGAALESEESPYLWFAVEDGAIMVGIFDLETTQRCPAFIVFADPSFIEVSYFIISARDENAKFNFSYGDGRLDPLAEDDEKCSA
ncbi:uncharacterized protein [Diadema antillarum]|uniref:uncharacterized protein n=1 Tax=Diadema antillarum TaxID=105358 RepID=UPI003A85E04D